MTAELLRHNRAAQSRADLDADILQYVPEFHSQGRAITIRQLLNHTSGIQSLTEVPKYAAKERLDLTDAEILDTFQDEPPALRARRKLSVQQLGLLSARHGH